MQNKLKTIKHDIKHSDGLPEKANLSSRLVAQVELKSQVNSFLKRAFKYGFCSRLYTIDVIADDADMDLFRKMTRAHHCAQSLLLPVKSGAHNLRPKGHTYELPRYDTEMYKN